MIPEKDVPKFTMGTDPEFVILDKNEKLLEAAAFLPRHDHGRAGLDPNEMGTDGHPWTGELRPPPGSPAELTESIRRILRENLQRFPNGEILRAGAFVHGKSLGGHIHFGFKPIDNLTAALDGVESQLLAAIENPDEAKRRRAGQYGGLSDVRPQPHGFEYRTPSSFIVNPTVTRGVLALAKAIAVEELTGGPMCMKKLRGSLAKLVKVDVDRYRKGDRAHFVSLVPELWKVIRAYQFWKTPEGKKLWRDVAALKTLTDYPGGWHNGNGLLERWRLVTRPTTQKLEIPQAERRVPAGVIRDAELWAILAGEEAAVVRAPARREREAQPRPAAQAYRVAANGAIDANEAFRILAGRQQRMNNPVIQMVDFDDPNQ